MVSPYQRGIKFVLALAIGFLGLVFTLAVPVLASGPQGNGAIPKSSLDSGNPQLTDTLKAIIPESTGSIQSATVTTPTRDVSVAKSIGQTPVPGGQFQYGISYANLGNSIASNVIVTDTLPPNVVFVSSSGCVTTPVNVVGNQVVWNLGAVAPGTNNGVLMVVSVTNATPVGTVLTNVVRISTSDVDVNLANNVFTHTTSVVSPTVDLVIVKDTSGYGGAPAGDLQYSLSYFNFGTDSASGIVITDVLPANVSYLSHSASGFTTTVAGNMIVFTRTSVLPGLSSGSIGIRVRVPATVLVGAVLTNVVRITSSNIDANPGDNVFTQTTTIVSPTYDVNVFKSILSGPGFIGTAVTYSLSFANGSNYTATNVVLTDVLPSGMNFVSWSGVINNPDPVNLTTIVTPVINGNQITWTLGSIVQGGNGFINVVALIDPAVAPGTPLTNTAGITLANSDVNPSNNFGFAALLATKFCGPDAFGYTCRDNTMAAGPIFKWIDATDGLDTGIKTDDGHFGPYPIGFDFLFYGQTYSETYLSSNGLVVFSPNSSFTNNRIPNSTLPNNFLAPMWDDLFVCGNSQMYTKQGGVTPNRYFVVEWHNVTRFADANTRVTFEAILRENGVVEYQYQSLTGTLNSATVGIEQISGTIGTMYLFNQSGLVNGRAVAFIPPGVQYNYAVFLPLVLK